ncbi:heme-binding protein [Novosphingobium sp. FSW06-99]|uniref:GlcG/HbpS family heme-binding protein n=1 Tax=Novosphingobium sp. FSW06-99 TaxID=1739113 RepID=UPI00076D257C|nr:heme-binding protein [Novosphingobium sp. FSW06-99]KUR76366.1 GlcG protein [Novosphingobium sp. FSW06-99]
MITLASAQAIITAALAHARASALKPLAVVVLDAGGHAVALAREDGASFGRETIARAKAHGALAMGDDTAAIAERAKGNPVFYASLVGVFDGGLALSPGGMLVRDGDGAVIGAVGISGDTGPADATAAIAGIVAAGFAAGATA